MIKNVTSYLEKLNEIQKSIEKPKEKTLFYRGISDEDYAKRENDKPSIYRNAKHINNEHKMYYELISKCADDFKDCNNTFEHLVKMQHYGFPTRLLDITSNALVALYFACSDTGNIEKCECNSKCSLKEPLCECKCSTCKRTKGIPNGQIIIYQIASTKIRNYESDRVSMLSNLTKANPACKYVNFLLNQTLHILQKLKNSQNEYTDAKHGYNKVNHALNSFSYFTSLTKINDELIQIFTGEKGCTVPVDNHLLRDTLDSYSDKFPSQPDHNQLGTIIFDLFELNKNFNKDDVINSVISSIKYYQSQFGTDFDRYCYSVRNEKIGFNSNLMDADHIKTVQFVRPKLTNPRIIAQSGFFILFGLNPLSHDKSAPKIDDRFYVTNKDNKIIIDGESKGKILEELKSLGITDATLFPEISDSAKEIAKKYADM